MRNDLGLKAAIMLIGIAPMAEVVIIPGIAKVYADFPQASSFIRAFLLSGPMLVAIPCVLIFGKLAEYFSKKSLLIFGYTVFLLAGVGASRAQDVYTLAVLRGLQGIPFAVFGSVGFGLIAELFKEEVARARIIGGTNAVMSAAAITLATVSGFLSDASWRTAFLLFLIGIPIVTMFAVFLPRVPPDRTALAQASHSARPRLDLRRIAAFCVAGFFVNILWMILYYFVGIYVFERQLGGPSTGGLMVATLMAGGLISGVGFAFHYRTFKRFTPVVFFFGIAASYLALSFQVPLYVAGAVILLSGWAYGLSFAYYYLKVTNAVPVVVASLAAAVLNVCISLASYFAPFALELYQKVFHVQTTAGAMPYIAITVAVCGAISLALSLRNRSSGQEEPREGDFQTHVR